MFILHPLPMSHHISRNVCLKFESFIGLTSLTNLEDKSALSLETEGLLHSEIRDLVDTVNYQADSSPSLALFNRVFRFFEDLYNRNVALVGLTQTMNDRLLANVKEVQELIASTKRDHTSAEALRAEYDKAIAAAKELDEKESQNIQTLQALRSEARELRTKLCFEPADLIKFENEQANSIRKAMDGIREEMAVAGRQISGFQSLIENTRREYEACKQAVAEAKEDLGQTDEGDMEQTIAEMHAQNEEQRRTGMALEKEIDEMEVRIKEGEQREAAARARIIELTKVLAQQEVLLQAANNEKTMCYIRRQKDERLIKKVRVATARREAQVVDRQRSIDKFTADIAYWKVALEELSRDLEADAPKLDALLETREEIRHDGVGCKKRAMELHGRATDQQYQVMFATNANQHAARVVDAQRYIRTGLEKQEHEEKSKTDAMAIQREFVAVQVNVARQQSMRSKGTALTIEDEIEEMQKARRTTEITASVVEMISEEVKNTHQEAMDTLGQLSQRNAVQTEMILRLRHEKNLFKQRCATAKQEHEAMHAQYTALVDSVRQMTVQIDRLLKSCTEVHFQCSAINETILMLTGMKQKCEAGIFHTQQTVLSLQTEIQNMKRLLDQTEKDRSQQNREWRVVANSQFYISRQLAERDRQLERMKGDISTDEGLLSKRASEFAQVMNRIDTYIQELTRAREGTIRLLRKKDYLVDLELRYQRLFQNLNIEKTRTMVLYYESNMPRLVHPLRLLSATNPEVITILRYRNFLSGRIIASDQELKSLCAKRDEMRKASDAQVKAKDECPSKEVALAHMQRYAEDIAFKDEMIKRLHEKVQQHRAQTEKAVTGAHGAQLRLAQHRVRSLNLTREIRDSQRDDVDATFCTEQRALFMEKGMTGGGFTFKPRPPSDRKEPHGPGLHIERPGPKRTATAGQSQRSQRRSIKEVQRKLTRPCQSARRNL
jgi:chromosome segregation ATPase